MADDLKNDTYDEVMELITAEKFDEGLALARRLLVDPATSPYFRIEAAMAIVSITEDYDEAYTHLKIARWHIAKHIEDFELPEMDEIYEYVKWQVKRGEEHLAKHAELDVDESDEEVDELPVAPDGEKADEVSVASDEEETSRTAHPDSSQAEQQLASSQTTNYNDVHDHDDVADSEKSEEAVTIEQHEGLAVRGKD